MLYYTQHRNLIYQQNNKFNPIILQGSIFRLNHEIDKGEVLAVTNYVYEERVNILHSTQCIYLQMIYKFVHNIRQIANNEYKEKYEFYVREIVEPMSYEEIKLYLSKSLL